jgi:hypothetical protein
MSKHYHRAAKHQAGKLNNAGGRTRELVTGTGKIVNASMASAPGGFWLPKLACCGQII